jgi:hypothetical protein
MTKLKREFFFYVAEVLTVITWRVEDFVGFLNRVEDRAHYRYVKEAKRNG